MEITTLSDPVWFAQAIRDFAQEAHDALTHSPSPAALRRLAWRVEFLASTLGHRPTVPVKTWLENLGKMVSSRAVHQAGAPRVTSICA
jgi:hypothetical protein